MFLKLKCVIVCVVFFITMQMSSQEKFYTSFSIPANLNENANAVIRSKQLNITINAVDDMTVYEKSIITVLNKEGNSSLDAYVHYDNNVKIKTLEVQVFNQLGAVIKKINYFILVIISCLYFFCCFGPPSTTTTFTS